MFSSWSFLFLRRNTSSSVAVDDFPFALGASLFLADGRVSRLIYFGVGVSTTACLGSVCSEPATLRRRTSTFSPFPVSAVETWPSASPVQLPMPPSSKNY